MKVSAEWWRRLAALTLAAWVLAPARSGFAQVTTSTTSGAVTTTTDVATTTTSTATTTSTTSTTVPTETTLDPSATTTPPTFPMVLPENPNPPDTPAVGPTFIASVPATITTEVVLPFSTPFSRATTTTLDVETIAFGAPTTASVTTTTTTATTLPPPTTAPRMTTLAQAAPAPVPSAAKGESTGSPLWMVLAGMGVLAVAAVAAWRRVRGSQQQ